MWLVATSAVRGNLPFRLDVGSYIVGRTHIAQIVIADSTVSRRHARLVCAGNSVTIEDLESSNGTFVNEHSVSKCCLQAGDYVRLGSVTCSLSPSPLTFPTLNDCESTCQIPVRSDHQARMESFTPAQREIIPHLMDGRSETEIASKLGKSRHTIHTHVRAMYQRLGVHSREEMIVKLLIRQ